MQVFLTVLYKKDSKNTSFYTLSRLQLTAIPFFHTLTYKILFLVILKLRGYRMTEVLRNQFLEQRSSVMEVKLVKGS